MMTPNRHYQELEESYLFHHIAQKTAAYLEAHPGTHLYRMGIGDVSRPLCPAVIEALHQAVEDQAHAETFQGYQPECGAPFFREAVAGHYRSRGVAVDPDEVFVSSGASDELGDILDLFDSSTPALIMEPAYPAYVDANVLAGRPIVHIPTKAKHGFLAMPDEKLPAGIIYLCSPNNPTGATFDRAGLQAWVDHANRTGSVILFDAAYEAFIEDPELPHSIFELEGARTCAIEICSLSKTAGFTGTRCGYTVVPLQLTRKSPEGNEMSLNKMWLRRQTTKFNGVNYIVQRGAEAAMSPVGEKECGDMLAYYRENARMMMETFDKKGYKYYGGVYSPYVWVKCPNGMGSWEYFDHLLNDLAIVGTPGAGFGTMGEGYLRLSAFGTHEGTKEAMERIEKDNI